jgi:hypothetical protein
LADAAKKNDVDPKKVRVAWQLFRLGGLLQGVKTTKPGGREATVRLYVPLLALRGIGRADRPPGGVMHPVLADHVVREPDAAGRLSARM